MVQVLRAVTIVPPRFLRSVSVLPAFPARYEKSDKVSVGAGMVPAAFGVIAKDFGVTHQQASYLTTSYTLLGGLTPLLLTPYVNMYGRRPAYLVSDLQSFDDRCP